VAWALYLIGARLSRRARARLVTVGVVTGTTEATTSLSSSQQRIYNYVSARSDGAPYLMAAPSLDDASSYILATGAEV
jgi:hypothetical protein